MTLWIKTVFFDILFGNRQRVWRDVHRVDFPLPEGISTGWRCSRYRYTYLKKCAAVAWLMSPAIYC